MWRRGCFQDANRRKERSGGEEETCIEEASCGKEEGRGEEENCDKKASCDEDERKKPSIGTTFVVESVVVDMPVLRKESIASSRPSKRARGKRAFMRNFTDTSMEPVVRRLLP